MCNLCVQLRKNTKNAFDEMIDFAIVGLSRAYVELSKIGSYLVV